MINANELRIGNYLQDEIELEKMLPVFKIEPGIITCGDEDFTYPYLAETLKPIPLTPEILEKAGYQYRNEHRGGGAIMDHADGQSIGIRREGGLRMLLAWKAPIDYLHQLQNLHFALTGTELSITPSSEGLNFDKV